MIQFNHLFRSKEAFENELSLAHFDRQSSNILIQMFSSVLDPVVLEKTAKAVLDVLPNAILIGASSAGEIINGSMADSETVLSISVFEKSTIKAASLIEKNSRILGEKLGKALAGDEVRCIICFADGLRHSSGFIEALREQCRAGVPIGGGMAGDLFRFEHTYTIYQGLVFEGGAVGVALSGDALEVFQDYNLGWRPVGSEMTITRAEGNRVYEIDGQPAVDMYKTVLGEEVAKNLPHSAIGFPLVRQSGSIFVARAMIGASDDGSILFAGDLHEGERVHFGVGSADMVNRYDPSDSIRNRKQPLQAAFVYSCSARKQFLGPMLETSLQAIDGFAPTSGFFTYGEFYVSDEGLQLLNITSTILFLHENGTAGRRFIAPVAGRKKQRPSNVVEEGMLHLIDYNTKALERKSASLAAAERRLEEHIEGINKVLIVSKTDPDGNITYVNSNFERISGYSRSELLGQSHNIVRNPLTPDTLFSDLWKTIKAGEIWHGSFANLRKDGTTYYVKSSIIPVFDKDHNIAEYFAIREDITDLVETQNAYKRESTFSHMLFDSDENIKIVIRNGKIERINQSFFRLFPFRDLEEFMRRQHCINAMFIPKEGFLTAGGASKPWYYQVLNEPDRTHKVLMEDRKGVVRSFSVKANQFDFEDDDYVICSFNDVTELEEARVVAEKAEEAQANFLANMSHEIRTPMNGILGFTGLLRKTELNEQQKGYLDIIEGSSSTLLDIINDVLDFSKIKSNQMLLESIPTDLFAELNIAYMLMQPLADKKELNYHLKLDPRMYAFVFVDPTRLKQIVINLLSNAIKFTHAPGEVVFRTEVVFESEKERSQTVRFIVEDSGIGIPKEKQLRVFSPFAQANESTTREFGGTGLGLSICSSLVSAMGGELKLYSKEGKGTVFYFDLTLKPADGAEKQAVREVEKQKRSARAEIAPSLKEINPGLRVLVAEDLEMNRLLVQLLLSQHGIDAVFAENGKEAYEKVKAEPFDLVFMDVNMPVMNGVEATRRIREELGSRVPIIALTANALEGDEEKFLNSGMDGYLTKPLDDRQFDAVLRKYS